MRKYQFIQLVFYKLKKEKYRLKRLVSVEEIQHKNFPWIYITIEKTFRASDQYNGKKIIEGIFLL